VLGVDAAGSSFLQEVKTAVAATHTANVDNQDGTTRAPASALLGKTNRIRLHGNAPLHPIHDMRIAIGRRSRLYGSRPDFANIRKAKEYNRAGIDFICSCSLARKGVGVG